jgi:hypothetical protein
VTRREQNLITTYTNAFGNLLEHIVGTFGATEYAKINSNDKASAFITALTRDRG